MAYGMPSRARHTEAEDGFILIEVLVSALILAIVAGAVLALITATTHSAASERNHSVAYGLAQEDQARLRTERIANLKELDPKPREETIGGTTFYVESRGQFVNNNTGTASCSGEGATADYVELTSTVSSPALLHPVSIHSIVSPSNESLDPSHGTFAFQAKNATGEPLAGVSFSGTGAGNFNGTTNEEGCITFADVPAGNYEVKTSSPGRINPEGLAEPRLGIGVEASGTTEHVFSFDYPGTIEASFKYFEPKAQGYVPAAIDSMELYHGENGGIAITQGTPGGAMASTLKDSSVYPATYAVYAGSCESNNPDPNEKGENKEEIAKLPITAGGTGTANLKVPALNVSVTYENKKVKGAKVIVTDKKCQYNTRNVERTFTTDGLGHIATSAGVETEAVGLPYGEYTVCASIGIEREYTERGHSYRVTEYRRAEKTLSVKTLPGPAELSLTLQGTSSTTECS